jgi:thiosulfate/3-mercaptopyruvate sulfurtransferase
VGAGGAVDTAGPTTRRGDFAGTPGSMPVVDADGLLAVPVVVDARAPERYRGEVEPLDPVAGHVPGAVNVETGRNLDGHGCFRSGEELRDLYAGVGAAAGAGVAAYCGSGVTATHDILAMEIAGIHAALFAPSWSGWVADPTREVERG